MDIKVSIPVISIDFVHEMNNYKVIVAYILNS